jgi:hypothetical protein
LNQHVESSASFWSQRIEVFRRSGTRKAEKISTGAEVLKGLINEVEGILRENAEVTEELWWLMSIPGIGTELQN